MTNPLTAVAERPLSLRERMSDSEVAPGIQEIAARLEWYALLVTPGREFVAQKILRRYGLKTFVPVRSEWRKRNRFSKEKELFSFAAAPRYVFAGFEAGVPLWFDLFALPNVSGVVGGLDGRPLRLPNPEMGALIRKTGGGINAPEVQKNMRTHHEFMPGDIAEVVAGPFEGMRVPVHSIAGLRATVILELFGGAVQEVDMPLDSLQAA